MDLGELTAYLRHSLNRAPPPAPGPGLIRAAQAHRLAGYLAVSERAAGRPVPEACESAWTQQLAGHLSRLSALAERWPQAAPPPLIYKGADLAEHLYPDPGARAACDLDLLLPSAAWASTVDQLTRQADARHLGRSERLPWEPPEGIGLRFGPVLLELHRDPAPRGRFALSGDALYARSTPTDRYPLPARRLDPVDRLLCWLVNLAKAGLHGDLAHWLDGALLLGALPKPAYATLARRLETHRLTDAWTRALGQLHHLAWPCPLPAPARPIPIGPPTGWPSQRAKLSVLPLAHRPPYLLRLALRALTDR